MDYKIVITGPAEDEIEEAAGYIASNSYGREIGWRRDVLAAIGSLAELPSRCPIVREPGPASRGVRHLLMHSHRIVFRIDDAAQTVVILSVYPQAGRGLV